MLYAIIIFVFALFSTDSLMARNPRRSYDATIPTITVYSTDPQEEEAWASCCNHATQQNKTYSLHTNFLRLKPIKNGFDSIFFQQHYLPEDNLTYRDQSGVISGATLSKLANDLVEEIKEGKRDFTHFTILKDKDFNYKTRSGLLVLKYKKYPFVLKISIEHPHTLIAPFSKSYEATGIFLIGGNLRHLSNFTRITNLERIKQILSYNPFYLNVLDFPRKWYWKPVKEYELKINWYCNGAKETMTIPSIYATISDFIETEKHQPQHELNKLSMKVATDVGFHIDPHAGNILIEKKTRKYVLLDTEDFRLMTGLSSSMKAKKYIGWYIELINNALNTCLFRDKEERLKQSLLI